MNSPLQFEQVADTALYETRVDGTVGWAGYILPTGTLPPNIGITESLSEYEGHYLLAVSRPPIVASDPVSFTQETKDYIKRNAKKANRAVVWLKSIEPAAFGKFANFGFEFNYDGIFEKYLLRSDLNADLGQNLNFFALQNLELSVNSNNGELAVSIWTGDQPLIGFQKQYADTGITVEDADTQGARIPLSGPNAGCFVFSARIEPSTTFSSDNFDLGFKYIVKGRESGQEEQISYFGFDVPILPQSLSCVGTVDPSDPLNTKIPTSDLMQGHLRTGFALADAPSLASAFRTAGGRVISLVPLATSANASRPPLMAGAFALVSSSRTCTEPGQAVAYFAPAGKFGMTVDGQDAGVAQDLLCGLFGSERLTFVTYDEKANAKNDTLFFLPSQSAYASVFPFETATLENPDSGNVRQRLNDDYLTPWATIFAGASQVQYRAEPEGSPLYALDSSEDEDATTILISAPPKMPLPQGTDHTFPLVPYARASKAGVDDITLTQFESQILAATRKTIISNAAQETWQARAAALLKVVEAAPAYGTTPQGLVAQIDPESGAYLNVQLAQSTDQDGTLVPFAFDKPTRQVQDALQTNQLFLVAVNDQHFDDTSTGATFHNVVHISDWTMTAQVGSGATPTSYRNVMILKFCDGSLQERVTNPNRWTAPEDFSLVDGAGTGAASIAYTGLSQWLQAYIAEGVERARGPSGGFYKNFEKIATDPSWNGVIVLQADLALDDLPPQIRGLAAGIDFSHFVAHHFGFTASRVSVDRSTGQISMAGNSSLFGLIDYEEPTYALNLAAGVDPDTPVPVQTSDDFDFTVLQLQSLFENARLVDFKSRVQLTVDRLFSSKVTRAYNNGLPMPANGVVLDGSYVDQNGTASYVFQQTHSTVFLLDSNVLSAVAFNRVQFNTLGTRDDGATVASRFLIWGAFDFVELIDTDEKLLDVLSFGSPPETEPAMLGQGLVFSNLVIEMTFPEATPNAKTFALDTDNLAYDLNVSSARDDSLFKGFGLQLKSFITAAGDKTPADYGFLPVTSTLNLKQLDKPWFGLVYEVTLGGPGALASAAGFTSNMLLAWAPSTTAQDTQRAVFIGLSLPGAAPGAKLFSVQGIFKVAIGSIALLRQEVPKTEGSDASDSSYFYCLRLDDIGIKILGIVKLPPDANIQFFLFGDPGNTGSLGWYAAYVAKDNPGVNQQKLGFAPLDTQQPLMTD